MVLAEHLGRGRAAMKPGAGGRRAWIVGGHSAPGFAKTQPEARLREAMPLRHVANLEKQRVSLESGGSPSIILRSSVERLIALDAERLLGQVVDDANRRLPWPLTEELSVCVVAAADDNERATRAESREILELSRAMSPAGEQEDLAQGWIHLSLWPSEVYTPEIKKSLSSQIFKRVRGLREGPCKTLRELVALEVAAMRFAGDTPLIWPGAWEKRFESFLDAGDLPTLVACWYGDAAAARLGFPVLGFPQGCGRIYSGGAHLLVAQSRQHRG